MKRKVFVVVLVALFLAGVAMQAFATEGLKDINRATAEDLVLVKGIGQKRAEAIVNFISRRSGIRSMDELVEVKGVGKKVLEELKGRFEVRLKQTDQ